MDKRGNLDKRNLIDTTEQDKGIWICTECGAENMNKFEICRNCAKGLKKNAKIIDKDKVSKYIGEIKK